MPTASAAGKPTGRTVETPAGIASEVGDEIRDRVPALALGGGVGKGTDVVAGGGANADGIAEALRLMVGCEERVTRFRDEQMNEDYDVQVRVQRANALARTKRGYYGPTMGER